MNCLTACFREGVFPASWKISHLILFKKLGKPDLVPLLYRSICLLSEAGKLFKKIICNHLMQSLDESGDISESQYGFRPHRSTVDAIWRLRMIVNNEVWDGRIVLAILFDIANAFNSPVAGH